MIDVILGLNDGWYHRSPFSELWLFGISADCVHIGAVGCNRKILAYWQQHGKRVLNLKHKQADEFQLFSGFILMNILFVK